MGIGTMTAKRLGAQKTIKGTSKNVIPVKTGIQKPLISLDSRLRGSDKLVIIRGSLNLTVTQQYVQ